MLQVAAPASLADDENPRPTVGDALASGFRSLGSGVVIVFLDAATPDRLEPLAASIRRRPGVVTVLLVDRDDTFAEFKRLFAGNDRMLANVTAADLPTSVQVVTRSPAAAEDVASWAERQPHVYEVVQPADEANRLPLMSAMISIEDRRAWRTAAGRLDRVEGRPRWALDAAATLRDLLERGPQVAADPDSATRALGVLPGLAHAAEGCGPQG
ncbi:permease-like cell division protein FtsX [Aquihabitans sp. G128]|uniref:permease-like cell division protein FtsX n=1 Tax=Aquihabitans sp. G128 TaxID=2849779 RepID=UPI001C25034C|nr:permease-like cell division protein FtsX [Aquihabitans sp. G128]QXC62438.1 permease-like cell division protein FtsX [Aquihabitans sp. G128]